MKYTLMLWVIGFALFSCEPKKQTAIQSEPELAVPDSVYDQIFFPKGESFTGGDGTYSVPLPDGRTVWIFGDSFIGHVTPELKRQKTEPVSLVRNTLVVIDGDSLITFTQGKLSELKSMLIPDEVTATGSKFAEHDYWYWPGDGLVENGKLKVFVSKFFQQDHTDMWAFKFQGTELAELSLPDLKVQKITQFPDTDSVHYGHAILEQDEHTYVYGLKKGKPYAARAIKGELEKPWEFFDGKGWTNNSDAAVPMLDFSGSEQFSVFEYKDTYVLIMQEGNLSQDIYSFTASSPTGPWGNKQFLYKTPLPENCKSCWTYNALAHPQFTENDKILISYNTNTMDFEEHFANANIYRPRFIRVPWKKISGN